MLPASLSNKRYVITFASTKLPSVILGQKNTVLQKNTWVSCVSRNWMVTLLLSKENDRLLGKQGDIKVHSNDWISPSMDFDSKNIMQFQLPGIPKGWN